VVRTRIRQDQEQDIDFVSESELNEFFGTVVITGTLDPEDNEVQDTVVTQSFKDFFPGQGLIADADGIVVTTGTQLVTISGFRSEFLAASGSLQFDIDDITFNAAGVTSITTSGTTVTGTVLFNSLSGITLIPDAGTNTITFSGTGVTRIITISGIEGDITISGAGEVDVITEGNTIVISGTDHTPEPNAIVGGTGITVTSGSNVTTVDGHLRYTKAENDAIIGGYGTTVTSGSSIITIDTFDDDDVDSLNSVTGTVTILPGAGIQVVTAAPNITIHSTRRALLSDNFATVISGTSFDLIAHKAITGSQGNVVTSGSNFVNIGHIPKALLSDNFATVVSGSSSDTIRHKAIKGDNFITVATGTNAVNLLADSIIGIGGITVTSGTNHVTVSGEATGIGSIPGKTYQISYGNSGVTSNKWLEVGHGNPSNQSPHVLPFSSQLIAMTFSNKNPGISCDVEVYVAASGVGASPITNVITWQLRNVRVGRRTDVIASGISFTPGQKVAIYVRNQGSNPQDTVVNMYLQIDVVTEEVPVTENFSGNFTV